MATKIKVSIIALITFLLGLASGNTQQMIVGAIPDTLNDQQIYILTEILADRTPQLNVSKHDAKTFSKDYADITKLLNDDIDSAVRFCMDNRKSDECNLYQRIKNRVAEVQ